MESLTYLTVCVPRSKIQPQSCHLCWDFPVNKESTSLSVLCMKCRRELDKFEKFFEGLSVFKEKADQTLKEQIEMTERGTHVNRV